MSRTERSTISLRAMIMIKCGSIRLIKYFSALFVIWLLLSAGITIYDLVGELHVSDKLKESYWGHQAAPDQKVIAIITPARKGELNQALMLKDSLEKLGQLSYIQAVNESFILHYFYPVKFFHELALHILAYLYKPDLYLAMSFHVIIELPEPKLMYISMPPSFFEKGLLQEYPSIINYQRFVDINKISDSADWLSPILGKQVMITPGMPGIPANQYQSSNRQSMVMFGSIWGRSDNNIYNALVELAKQNYMYFIFHPALLLGFKDRQIFTDKAKTYQDLLKVLNHHGIALCIHSKYHHDAGIATSRIFEIIASGAVMISDKHPFLVKNFGDSILYFDRNLPANELFTQIDTHVAWVQKHPQEAEVMAKRAHQILQEKFTTEKFALLVLEHIKK